MLSMTDQTGSVPDPGEAELLARALLLSVDVAWSRREEKRPEDDGLEQLFFPLLDVLRRLSTSVYLVLRKTDKSLQLMLQLLRLLGTQSQKEEERGVCCL